MRGRKARVVLVAPNIEPIAAQGGLDDQLGILEMLILGIFLSAPGADAKPCAGAGRWPRRCAGARRAWCWWRPTSSRSRRRAAWTTCWTTSCAGRRGLRHPRRLLRLAQEAGPGDRRMWCTPFLHAALVPAALLSVRACPCLPRNVLLIKPGCVVLWVQQHQCCPRHMVCMPRWRGLVAVSLFERGAAQVFGCRKKMSAIAILDISGAEHLLRTIETLAAQGCAEWHAQSAAGDDAAVPQPARPSEGPACCPC